MPSIDALTATLTRRFRRGMGQCLGVIAPERAFIPHNRVVSSTVIAGMSLDMRSAVDSQRDRLDLVESMLTMDNFGTGVVTVPFTEGSFSAITNTDDPYQASVQR